MASCAAASIQAPPNSGWCDEFPDRGKKGEENMGDRLGVGIVGYGKVASGAHRRWITGRDTVRLAAVCDTTPVRRDAALSDNPGVAVYDGYDEFLADPEIDLVVVTTPPNSHRDLAVRAAEAGKHVFVDKPFAMTRAEALDMLAAADKTGVVMHCHQSRRYDGEYRRIREVVRAGRIGEIVHIRRVWSQYGEAWASWGIPGFNPTWRVQREFGGGMVYDYAPHCGDQVLQLMAEPLSQVYADVRSIKFSKEVDDHFSCTMRFAGGATALVEASNMARLESPHWYVVGTTGCITAQGVNSPIQVLTDEMDEPEILQPLNELQDLYDNLIAACAGGAKANVTPDELKASMGLIDAIFASGKSGAAVSV